VATSFGGFMRGQAIQAIVLASVAAAGSLLLELDYMPLTTALVAIFQFIPFFGPFVSWAPPVVAAILTQPDALIPIAIIMGAGWFVTMNLVQPRVMASSVGIHPVVVLLSVLIGLRLQGVIGAIFAIPVAAVISAFFFHYLNRSQGGPRDVASRAARRLEEREGRPVRVPTPPVVGVPAGAQAMAAAGAEPDGSIPPSDDDEERP
jgi:predicted PurR-regulated permease PerM